MREKGMLGGIFSDSSAGQSLKIGGLAAAADDTALTRVTLSVATKRHSKKIPLVCLGAKRTNFRAILVLSKCGRIR
jgi:hypothetical protein